MYGAVGTWEEWQTTGTWRYNVQEGSNGDHEWPGRKPDGQYKIGCGREGYGKHIEA